MRRSSIAAVLASLCLAFGAAGALAEEHNPSEKLKVAMDVGYAPWAMRAPDNSVEGFQVDFLSEIARRIGRPGIEPIDTNFSAIFAGLFSKRYEIIGSPIAITKERAEQMAFTESYNIGGNGFSTLASAPDITKIEDLKGKALATNSGSVADGWLTANAEKIGFTVQRYDKDTDALQAVIAGRADAVMTDIYRSRYAANLNKRVRVSPFVIVTTAAVGLAIRKDDTAFLESVESAIECMKIDGTMAKINVKWFGDAPAVDSPMVTPFPGIGAVGMPGYDPAPSHKIACR